jgi:hypothetical protein
MICLCGVKWIVNRSEFLSKFHILIEVSAIQLISNETFFFCRSNVLADYYLYLFSYLLAEKGNLETNKRLYEKSQILLHLDTDKRIKTMDITYNCVNDINIEAMP